MTMTSSLITYDHQAQEELARWQKRMQQKPSFLNKLSKRTQNRINRVIPEKVHTAITAAIKQMTRALIFGAGLATPAPIYNMSLADRENKVRAIIKAHRNTATAEGAITGAGGLLLGLADFPIWLGIKMKMLFEIAAAYGMDTRDYKERIYLLHIFQLTFSSQQHRNTIYSQLERWKDDVFLLPADIHQFDWRSFQQEYRDYIDIAKLLQLVPGIGAVVGAYVNHRLTEKLGQYAMNAYRMRTLPA
jgi:uncharacterized protein (DUF697 family)